LDEFFARVKGLQNDEVNIRSKVAEYIAKETKAVFGLDVMSFEFTVRLYKQDRSIVGPGFFDIYGCLLRNQDIHEIASKSWPGMGDYELVASLQIPNKPPEYHSERDPDGEVLDLMRLLREDVSQDELTAKILSEVPQLKDEGLMLEKTLRQAIEEPWNM
jgi:hypothetical protein